MSARTVGLFTKRCRYQVPFLWIDSLHGTGTHSSTNSSAHSATIGIRLTPDARQLSGTNSSARERSRCKKRMPPPPRFQRCRRIASRLPIPTKHRDTPQPEISPRVPLLVLGVSLAKLGPRSYALRAPSRLPSPPTREPSPPYRVAIASVIGMSPSSPSFMGSVSCLTFGCRPFSVTQLRIRNGSSCPEGDLPADGFGRLGWVPPAGAKRRLGLTPTRKRRLFTAHAECRRWPGVTTDLT